MSSLAFLDMQRSYSEGVGQGYHSKPPAYGNNVRYQLAKAKVDDLFLKWLSNPASQKLIASLIQDIKSGKQAQLISQPSAYFTNKLAMSCAMSQSSILSSPNQKHAIRITPTTPPRNDALQELKQIRVHSDDLTQSLTQSQVQQKKSEQPQQPPSLKVQQSYIQQYEAIPQFYFPEGKPLDASLLSEQQRIINEAFKQSKTEELDIDKFLTITTQACSLPKQFNPLLFKKIDTMNTGKIGKAAFMKYWHLNLTNKEPKQRCFWILKKNQNDFIEFDDFKPYMKVLLESHPGLEFLQATPEFQDRYADTVVHRIFYSVNKRDNGKISWREFKQSDIFYIMEVVDKEEDINKIRQYFSYEHFYVIYCKFWELDNDHDFHISKDDFSRYSSHALSRKAVDRIFDQVPRKFKSQIPGKMSYDDFIWFILSEEDKTTSQSIEYWFKVIDLDDNGIITGQEMEYFYDEQRQRMDYLNHEPVLFQDLVCQMVDLLHPENDIIFRMSHFKQKLAVCGVFFNFLVNLNKLVAYEQRDPFQQKHELTEHPGYSDWDRFATQEYLRLAMEEENQDQGEVFEGDNPWDNEGEDSKA